jgi:hypothetical protein
MMRTPARGFRVQLLAAILGVALSACGGHGGARSVLPGSPATTGGGSTVPKSTNVALFDGELWYGAGASLYGVPLQSGGASAELDGNLDGIVDAVPVAMTIAPDGTLYDLISDDETSWKLQAYAPGAFGAQRPEETISGSGYPQQVVLVGDGIDVLATTGFNTSNAQATLRTYAYGAGNNPQPIRKLKLGTNVSDVASDNLDRIYVARHGAGISVYAAAATCNCSPIRTIATGAKSNDAIAVSGDGIVYVLSKDPGSGAVTIDAYAPGNNGPAPSRTIGPIAASRGTPVGGITVDSDGKVYVNFKTARGSSTDVYAANANGPASPVNTIGTPSNGGYVTAIAIGPLVHGPVAPSGTLYVAGADEIDLFPVTASGSVSPRQRITGFYSAPGQPSYHNSRGLGGVAAGANGEFAAYQNIRAGNIDDTVSLLTGAAAPSGASITSVTYADDGLGEGLAIAPNGEIAIAIQRYEGPDLQRYAYGAPPTKLSDVPGVANFIAYGPNGDLFVRKYDSVVEYADPATLTAVVRTVPLPGYGPIAVAPDGTLYGDSATVVNNATTESIYAFPPGSTTPNRTIGPFAGSGPSTVAGLATDNASELYVALNTYNGTSSVIQVYGAQGLPAPVRTITNPIPADSKGGMGVVGIAVGT